MMIFGWEPCYFNYYLHYTIILNYTLSSLYITEKCLIKYFLLLVSAEGHDIAEQAAMHPAITRTEHPQKYQLSKQKLIVNEASSSRQCRHQILSVRTQEGCAA